MYEHLNSLIGKISTLDVTEPPKAWRLLTVISVGGLRSIGFSKKSENLLIVSSQGRGVIDCKTGNKVSRDYEDYYENDCQLEAEGIGPIENETINLAGLFGGGLPTTTEDGWSIENVSLSWPEESILLVEPGSDLYGSTHNYPDHFTKIYEDACIRAYGFSYTGNNIVIATTSDVTIYKRES